MAPRAIAAVLLPVAIVVGYMGVTAEETLAKEKLIRDNTTPKSALERRDERQLREMNSPHAYPPMWKEEAKKSQ